MLQDSRYFRGIDYVEGLLEFLMVFNEVRGVGIHASKFYVEFEPLLKGATIAKSQK